MDRRERARERESERARERGARIEIGRELLGQLIVGSTLRDFDVIVYDVISVASRAVLGLGWVINNASD